MTGVGDQIPMFPDEYPNLPEGRKRRDTGIQKVTQKAFGKSVRAIISLSFRPGAHVTGEDIRLICSARNIVPEHPNAWGGAIAGAIKAGQLVYVDSSRQMSLPRSHARRTPVYVVQ